MSTMTYIFILDDIKLAPGQVSIDENGGVVLAQDVGNQTFVMHTLEDDVPKKWAVYLTEPTKAGEMLKWTDTYGREYNQHEQFLLKGRL